MSAPSAMERLADKLAAADLDEEETALLVSLLAGSDEDEVTGFAVTSARNASRPVIALDHASPASWKNVLEASSKHGLFEGCYKYE